MFSLASPSRSDHPFEIIALTSAVFTASRIMDSICRIIKNNAAEADIHWRRSCGQKVDKSWFWFVNRRLPEEKATYVYKQQ